LQDRAAVIERARAAGVAAIVVTGCTVKSAQAARDLCESVKDYPLYFTAGVHPHNAKDCDDNTLEELKQLAVHERCVAIGGSSIHVLTWRIITVSRPTCCTMLVGSFLTFMSNKFK
jgi:TatD DNase family protein